MTRAKRPNLVVVHLESVSTALLSRFAEDFPNLTRLRERSVAFDTFFASAPSSIKSFCDFMHGNTSEMDHVVDWDDPTNGPIGHREGLMDVLRRAGYRTFGLGYPLIWRDDINTWKLFGEPPFAWHAQLESFRGALEEALSPGPNGEPFAAYVWDLRSHLSYSDADKPADLRGFERLRAGYRAIDGTLGRIVDILRERDLLDDTVVVAYGDHGDQFWTHGLYFGFCHAFEPYTDVIRTPAFILDATIAPRRITDVVSLIDLAPTLLALLGIDEARGEPRWDDGIDVLADKRTFAHCQSLFANQQPNKALPKSFSVTNDEYHLIVSASGLELYAHRMDPANHNNLLSFFEYEDGRLAFDDRGATHGHFRNTFNPAQVAHIEDAFYALRGELVRLVRAKYEPFAENLAYGFDASAFFAVRPRELTWNRSHLEDSERAEAVRAETCALLSGSGRYASLLLSGHE